MATLAIFMAFWMGFAPLSAAAMVMQDALLLLLFLVELQIVVWELLCCPLLAEVGNGPSADASPATAVPLDASFFHPLLLPHEFPMSDRVQVGGFRQRCSSMKC